MFILLRKEINIHPSRSTDVTGLFIIITILLSDFFKLEFVFVLCDSMIAENYFIASDKVEKYSD